MASADPDAASPEPQAASQTLTRGFLFADLRGYTAFVESRGAAAAADLLDRYRALVRRAVARHRGAEIKTEGDSFYVVFTSVSAAVACALEIVRDAAGSQDVTAPIKVGIGVHAGETVETPEGYVGSAVNVAARLCAVASAGQVLVSQTVRDLTANTSDVRFAYLGRRRLKGISEPVAVHRAVAADAPLEHAVARRPAVRLIAVSAVGVLVVLGVFVGLMASGSLPRLAGQGGSASPVPSSSAAGSTQPITEIAIPPYVPDQPEPSAIPLAAGTYRFTAFRPQTTFSVAQPGWSATEDLTDTFTLARDGGYLTAALIQVVSAGPCVDSPTRLLDQTPHALVKWLQSTPYVKVSDPKPVIVGGYAGLSVEITQAIGPTDCSNPPGRDALFQVGSHTFFLGGDERVLVVAVDARPPVTLLVGAVDQRNFASTIETAQSIIQSIVFTP